MHLEGVRLRSKVHLEAGAARQERCQLTAVQDHQLPVRRAGGVHLP